MLESLHLSSIFYPLSSIIILSSIFTTCPFAADW